MEKGKIHVNIFTIHLNQLEPDVFQAGVLMIEVRLQWNSCLETGTTRWRATKPALAQDFGQAELERGPQTAPVLWDSLARRSTNHSQKHEGGLLFETHSFKVERAAGFGMRRVRETKGKSNGSSDQMVRLL